jgi:sulfur-oxidizing protein SoxX
MKLRIVVGMGVLLLLSGGCLPSAKSVKHFSLPEGDAVNGKVAFIQLKCQECHVVEGVKLPAVELRGRTFVHLGGERAQPKTYGDLLNDIVTPNHQLSAGYDKILVSQDGKTLMTNFNDTMTVSQLIDIVAFLQPKYKLIEPGQYSHYGEHPGGSGG